MELRVAWPDVDRLAQQLDAGRVLGFAPREKLEEPDRGAGRLRVQETVEEAAHSAPVAGCDELVGDDLERVERRGAISQPFPEEARQEEEVPSLPSRGLLADRLSAASALVSAISLRASTSVSSHPGSADEAGASVCLHRGQVAA